MKLSYNELLNKCEDIYETVSFTFNEAVMVEERTRGQSKSRAWFEQRAGRIAASKLREALHTNYLQPSVSLIKAICYPEQFLLHASMGVSMNILPEQHTLKKCNHTMRIL